MSQLCPEYLIARETAIEYIFKKPSFLYGELLKEIKKRGGLEQVSPSRTLSLYLDGLVQLWPGFLEKVPGRTRPLNKFVIASNI